MESTQDIEVGVSRTEDGSPGAYSLQELIKDVPLSTGEDGVQAHITCVDAWNGNVYIGTSAGEVLHYVSIPPDPSSDENTQSTYIFATMIEPPYANRQAPPDAGVKQILLLPNAGKACIVCNNTLTFYTLPELSPAFEGTKQTGCSWVGGIDCSANGVDVDRSRTEAIICLRQKLRLIRIREASLPQKIRDIELGSISALERRGDLACVADSRSYSLLDVVNQRKNDLSPISSLSKDTPSRNQLAPPAPNTRQASRSFSSSAPARQSRGHERNISLGGQPRGDNRSRPDSNSPWPARNSSRQSTSPNPPASPERNSVAVEEPSEPTTSTQLAQPANPTQPLRPNILSPTPNEFLITTGTRLSDPGVGMFINLDGDVSRGTLEFASYPESLVLDAASHDGPSAGDDESAEEGYVLGVVQKKYGSSIKRCIEAQRWDVDSSEARESKEWLPLETLQEEIAQTPLNNFMGLRIATSPAAISTNNASSSLKLRRLLMRDRDGDIAEAEERRNKDEDRLAARFAQTQARVLLYSSNQISWIVRSPLVHRLDQRLIEAVQQTSDGRLSIDVSIVQHVFNSIRGQEPRDELEFLTLTYIRQRSALLLFGNLVLQTLGGFISYEHDKKRAEDALVFGDVDPRVILTLVPPLTEEIIEGDQGIWMPQGTIDTVNLFRDNIDFSKLVRDPRGPYGENMLNVIKRYLSAWRKKKGFGSVADEVPVFQTVDAALVHVLLLLDQNSPRGPALSNSVRAELNDIVDNGVDCFDRAVELCEQYKRLHVLSRLYQSRRMVSLVLATWRRILDGEEDAGGEFIEGEQHLKKYLTKIRDVALVQEYGSWLAHRNPKLGVQVFADDNSRVQFKPSEAVAVLKQNAPAAVKDYLEHLVFGKNHVQYVNDLIAFYLDTVLSELEHSEEARTTLLQSYETYRALHPPKPTYRQFITDNALAAEWWQNRLRLLQLIGGSHGAASKYNVQTLGQRLSPYSNELVPEMIILNGREGKHQEALRLLTHGLGDYDTAIRYCLLGGSSIFHPTSSSLVPAQPLPTKDEQATLFGYLLHEFFRIEDWSERLERTAELLERFGPWFDVAEVLDLIPDSWSVELVSAFLVHAFRRLVRERNETVVVKALCSAQNIKQSVEVIEKCEAAGPTIVKTNASVDVGS